MLTLQVSGLLDARALVEETLEVAGQHALVVQHLFHVDLVETLHVRGQVLDLLVGGGGPGGLGQGARGRDHAAQREQHFPVHGGEQPTLLRCVIIVIRFRLSQSSSGGAD